MLVEEVTDMLQKPDNENELDDFKVTRKGDDPYVILVVGVNGVGKTTTIGKLAWQYKQAGNKVVLGAADTFRAAAIEQLDIWGQRVGVPVIKQKMGSDPAAVAFDTLQSAKAQGADVVIIDTAGRLHNKINLMNELTKVKSVMKRVVPDAPQEILLVLDGSTGQNAFEQARQFMAATEINNPRSHQTRRHLPRRRGDRNQRPVQDSSEIYRTPEREWRISRYSIRQNL